MSSSNPAIIEGIGNEVLVVFIVSGVALLLSIAWYSTHLTSTQTQMTSIRVQRRGVTLNRVPDSSTQEARAQESTSATGRSTEPPDDPPAPPGNQTTDSPNFSSDPGGSPSIESQPDNITPLDSSADNSSSYVPSSAPFEETNVNPTTATPTTTESTPPQHSESSQLPPNNQTIRVKLKFLTDSEKVVQAQRTDTIATFKRENFAIELENNKLVRLIFNGQVLVDGRTLQSYNIVDNTVVHALITDGPTQAPNTNATPEVIMFNAGSLMVPLFTVILALIWYLRFEFGQFFNVTSTMSLVCITIVFGFCMLAHRVPPTPVQRRTYGINVGAG